MAIVPMKTVGDYTFFYDKSCEFSNWFIRDFVVKGITFSSNEKLMMFAKAKLFNDEITAKKILATNSPGRCKSLGREVAGFVQAEWDARRSGIVAAGVFHKFDQHPDLRRILFRTFKTKMVEAAAKDEIWGIGLGINDPRITDRTKWRGLNLLGEALDVAKAKLIEKYPEEYAAIEREVALEKQQIKSNDSQASLEYGR